MEIEKSLENRLDYLRVRASNWNDENTEPPTALVLTRASSLIKECIKRRRYPSSISFSAEGGVCFSFINKDEIIYFELYNDKDVALLVENFPSKNLLKNEMIDYENVIFKLEAYYTDMFQIISQDENIYNNVKADEDFVSKSNNNQNTHPLPKLNHDSSGSKITHYFQVSPDLASATSI